MWLIPITKVYVMTISRKFNILIFRFLANTVCMQNGLDLIENPLLGNNFTTSSQTSLEWSLHGPLSDLYLTALPSKIVTEADFAGEGTCWNGF
jgi:hypothetical protein